MYRMTRSQLIIKIAKHFPQLSEEDTAAAVDAILGGMIASLQQESRVEIRGFGTFSLTQRKPRTGRNPRTGEKVAVPAKLVPLFKCANDLLLRVNSATAQST